MKIAEVPIVFGTAHLLLNNYRTIFWAEEGMLILSDLHLGKAAHFRKNGIAIPSQISVDDLIRFSKVMMYYKPRKVLIVGDFLHAGNNQEVEAFRDFSSEFPEVDFWLVKGNHDRLSEAFLKQIGIDAIFTSLTIGGIHFVHEMSTTPSHYEISGHFHPGIRVQLTSKKWLKLPCFVVGNQQLILPAFSQFTGLDTVSKIEQAALYAVSEEGLFLL